MSDSINGAVLRKLAGRADKGFLKYGVTMDRGDLTRRAWLEHLQAELLDAAVYAEKLILILQTETDNFALRAQVAELEKDKARLDWLDENSRGNVRGTGIPEWSISGADNFDPQNIRQAIDAAMDSAHS